MDPIAGEQRFAVDAGVFDDDGSWVYVWRTDEGEVVYVGATGLPPKVRAWLHVHDESPDIGRIRARYPELLDSRVEVVAFAMPPGIDRQRVKAALTAILAGAEPDPGAPAEVIEAAVAVAARLFESP